MKKSGSGGSGPGYVRHASHAGSWYSKDEGTLAEQLEEWLEAARRGQEEEEGAAAAGTAEGPVCAIIAPHAGFRWVHAPGKGCGKRRRQILNSTYCSCIRSYSGPTAAFAYMHLDAARVRRIFVIGPSHHVYLKCVHSFV